MGEREQAWKRTWMPPTSARAAIFQLHMPKYHDQLCKDMRVPHQRKGNPLAEVLMPYNARDYAELFDVKQNELLGLSTSPTKVSSVHGAMARPVPGSGTLQRLYSMQALWEECMAKLARSMSSRTAARLRYLPALELGVGKRKGGSV